MKEGRQGFAVDKRLILLAIVGFLTGRVWLFQINPFGVACFAAICAEKRGKKLAAFSILAGMTTTVGGIALLKYMLLFLAILAVSSVQGKGRWRTSGMVVALLCAGLNLAFGFARSIMSVNTWEMLGMAGLESVAILALTNVYQWGIRFLLYEDWKKTPGSEELLSILMLAGTALCGIPREFDAFFSMADTAGYWLVLLMGYRYSAAAGAIAGAAAGVPAALEGEEMALVGIYCLLGVSVGMFRRLGRVCVSLAFFVMGCIMVYAMKDQGLGIMELRAMVSAAILFLAIPGKVLHMIEKDEESEEDNPFAIEDVRAMANHRIEDFSRAFTRLSKSFENREVCQTEISDEEVERIFEELSQKICGGCVNCKYCWDKHLEETSLNIHSILWQAGRDGTVEMEKISPDFGRRCIRLASYVESAEEKMAVAKMNLGWRNRMAENREVISRQMREVGEALQAFTVDLGDMEQVDAAYIKEISDALRKEGIRVKKCQVKKRKGRLEIVFRGACQGNQCLTKTDIAKALSAVANVYLCPGRETRNVLSREETTMFFHEDTRYKALTGLARVAKAGENVSGDSYSFLELQTGELLMVLTDGMGSGETAYRDSTNLIETLEHLMEAGFEKKSALRLLNTLFVMSYEGTTFTTLDMVSINLHSGQCEIMKNGAAATFIRHADSVETVYSDALPMGVDIEAESDVTVHSLQEGDMVIMVSDGVIDGFYDERIPGNPEQEKTLEKLIEGLTCQNPNDMANQILMNALARSAREATDDMSVLVAGIWNKY